VAFNTVLDALSSRVDLRALAIEKRWSLWRFVARPTRARA
jgi:hypothetical protein